MHILDHDLHCWVCRLDTCVTSLLALQPDSPFLQMSASSSPLTLSQLIRLVWEIESGQSGCVSNCSITQYEQQYCDIFNDFIWNIKWMSRLVQRTAILALPIGLSYCWLLLPRPSALSAPHKEEWRSWRKKRAGQEWVAQSLLALGWTLHPRAPVGWEAPLIRSLRVSIQMFRSCDSN